MSCEPRFFAPSHADSAPSGHRLARAPHCAPSGLGRHRVMTITVVTVVGGLG